MSIVSRKYNPTVGATSIHHPSLYGVRILGVWRSGTAYNRVGVLDTPAGIEYGYLVATIRFDPTTPFNAGETVLALYET